MLPTSTSSAWDPTPRSKSLKSPIAMSLVMSHAHWPRRARRCCKAVPDSARVIALDISGTSRSSEGFAEHISKLTVEGTSHFVFVVGGAAGLDASVLERVDERLSLGPMTLPHQLARVVLLEQIYRLFRIMRNEPYHR